MNFCLEIQLTVNSSGFRYAMGAKHKQSEIQMVKRKAQAQVLTTASIVGRRNLLPEIKKLFKILPVHHDCNPNDQENFHNLKI